MGSDLGCIGFVVVVGGVWYFVRVVCVVLLL